MATTLLIVTVGAEVSWLVLRPHMTGGWAWAPLVAAVAAHLVLVERERRRPTLTRRSILVAVAIVLVVAVAVPPFGSRDLYSYAFYGRMVATHHANPYLIRPDRFSGDALLGSLAHPWRRVRTVYGPLFTGVSAVGALGYGTSRLLARLFFQSLEALAMLYGLLLLARRKVRSDALVFLGLSPALLAVVNGGHNDLLAGVLLLAGIVALERRRAVEAGLLLAAAVSVKLLILPGVLIVVVALWINRRGREAWRVGAIVATTTAAGYLFVGGRAALGPLSERGHSISRGSIWHGAADVLASWGGGPALSGVTAQRLAVVATAALGIILVARLRRPVDLGHAAVAALLVSLLATQYVLPWYSAMALPLAALLPPRARFCAYAQATLLLLVYVVAPGTSIRQTPLLPALNGLAPLIQFGLLVTLITLWPPGRPRRGAVAARG
ncbi:MAG: glycosyltransferase 87 family protein [Acidimicrobiales bacterium]